MADVRADVSSGISAFCQPGFARSVLHSGCVDLNCSVMKCFGLLVDIDVIMLCYLNEEKAKA